MEVGFPVDASRNAVHPGQWAEGEPTYWFLRILRMKGRKRYRIETWRCTSCGYLESYAAEAAS
jgi:hypothetical protein